MNNKMQSQDVTKWVDYIRQALENLEGEAWLQDIYTEIEKLSSAKYVDSSQNWQSNVRTTIYQHCSDSKMWHTYIHEKGIKNPDLFYKAKNTKKATYGLRAYKQPKVLKPRPPKLRSIKPKRVPATGTRIIRDTKLVRDIKDIHKNVCQICGEAFELLDDETYSEGHHLHPLGQPHEGPDIEENILIVCPNHHVQCDYGAIKIDWSKLHKKKGHKLQKKYVDFHNETIYGKEVKATEFTD